MNLYSICIGLGAALGLLLLARSARPKQVSRVIDTGLVLLALALAGARSGYVLLHHEYFSAHPGEIAAFWLGGLAWIGAAAGLLTGIPAAAWLNKISLAEAYRLTVLLATPLAVLIWMGCWTVGIGYGPTVNAPAWLAFPVMDETGQVLTRFPLQILCATLLLLLLIMLEAAAARIAVIQHKKIQAAGVVLCADLCLFAVLRADPVREILSFRPDMIAAAALLLLSLAALFLPSRDAGKFQPAVS
jgi:prolipoprotein diacylglyceryltransferase